MTDTTEVAEPPKAKKSKLPFMSAIITTLVGATGGYFAVSSNLLGLTSEISETPQLQNRTAPMHEVLDLAFVPLDPIIASFSSGNDRNLLRFVGSLEVDPSTIAEVEILKPRIIDILNGYLRALELEDLEKPAALLKIRSELLHRVRIVAGEDRINDLLIIEFVIN